MDQRWTAYNASLGDQALPKSTKATVPYQTTSSETCITGFQDLKPVNPQLQARYDAMSGSWEGIQPSTEYVYKNIAKTQAEQAPAK